jgi:hypothetical protein
VNFRVHDLDAMVAQLRVAGAAVDADIEVEQGAGRFASVIDPEGNKVQLWEPESPACATPPVVLTQRARCRLESRTALSGS